MKHFFCRKEIEGIPCIHSHDNHSADEILGYVVHHDDFFYRVNRSYWSRFICHLCWPLFFCKCIFSCFDTYQEPIYLYNENCKQCSISRENRVKSIEEYE